MGYRIEVDTSKYEKRRCSEKNWEPGTMNNYMEAINGWKKTEPSFIRLSWFLDFLCHGGKNFELYGTNPNYTKWFDESANKLIIRYYDELCGFERSQNLGPYGFAQGYINVGNLLEKIKKDGKAVLRFSSFYDARQYCKNMDGCYIRITKV